MQPIDFAPSQRVHVRRVPSGYWAFIPPPLPPILEFDASLVTTLSEADRALGRLAGVGSSLPNPYLLITPFLRREAVLSSRIEGTQATLSELVLFEAIPGARAGTNDLREVANHVEALETGIAPDQPLPLSLRLIRDLHGVLMTGVRGQERTPGEFRTSQNWIGPPGAVINNSTFVPPPPDEMLQALDRLERYLHASPDLPPIMRLALIHYQFEAIHPFLDGNGRVGRLLMSLLLHHWQLLPQPLLYLSAFFERHRNDYYRLLLEVSTKGAWQPWISFFATAVADQATDVLARSGRLLDLREEYRARLVGARTSSLPLRLVDVLFMRPAITIGGAQEALGVTWRSAQLNVEKLVQAQIVEEVTRQPRNRVYLAREIVGLLEE
ncbi:MAG: Fic family protein [Candidatus Limnocylindrales bacterium]